MRFVTAVALAAVMLWVPVDGVAQTMIGDWRVRENLDPFDDSSQTIIYLIAEDATSFSSGIRSFAIRCGIGGAGLSLAVGHSYMGGDDNRMRVTYRLGSAEAKTVTGFLTSDNDVTIVNGLNAPEVAALLSSPRVAVRIVDLLDNDTSQENWADLEGTAEAIGFLHCLS
jgi:hypothetical protein